MARARGEARRSERTISSGSYLGLLFQHRSNGTQVLQSGFLRGLPEVRCRHVFQEPIEGVTGGREGGKELFVP